MTAYYIKRSKKLIQKDKINKSNFYNRYNININVKNENSEKRYPILENCTYGVRFG